jgi:divinyl chlorophyllide a 8-vinyl-reductase
MTRPATPQRVFLIGATGTIGRATARALVKRGHDLTCLVRPGSNIDPADFPGATIREGAVGDPVSLRDDGFRGERFDALVSCLASRTGAPEDAWAIDHRAQSNALTVARDSGVSQVVLLSAICLQKPRLAFQEAKLAFESELMASGLTWSIVRPTAYFKSLSGQADRLRAGKPYLIFGDGSLTACKPISDRDTANYLADCLTDPTRHNRILPIGGPGPALTPRAQGALLFRALDLPPRFRSVPVRLLDAIVGGLALAGSLSPRLAAKAELARIGRYYATESMLVLDPATGRYDAETTPETGSDTLADHFAQLARGDKSADLREHAVF